MPQEMSPAAARDALAARLSAEGRLDLSSRLQKCGQPLTLRCVDCQRPREVFTRCDLKWCPSCQPALAARTADRFARIAKIFTWPLFVTFTVEHGPADSVELLRHVRRAHTNLRRQPWWKKRVAGGFICYEVTRLDERTRRKRKLGPDKGWHPHGHAILDCRWLGVTIGAAPTGSTPQALKARARKATTEVAAQWTLALGRTGKVKVRRVWRSHDGTINAAVHEVCKYSVKGSDLLLMKGDIGSLIDVLDRTRLSTPFGSAYGRPECKRRRNAPAACPCGCSSWLPEDVMARQIKRGFL